MPKPKIEITKVVEKGKYVPDAFTDPNQQADGFTPTVAQRRYGDSLALHQCGESEARKKTKTGLKVVEKWMMDQKFRNYLDSELKVAVAQNVGSVRLALLEKAQSGDVSAIKLYLETFDPEFKSAAKDKKGSDTYVQILQQIGAVK